MYDVRVVSRLDLASFQKALASLDRAIVRAQAAPEDEELRDAVIQRFEYTYEISWKMLKRQVELEHPSPAEVDSLSFADLLRESAERGLIDDVGRWLDFREQRNIASHTCDRGKAVCVYTGAVQFAAEARRLLEKIAGRNA